VGIGSQRRFDDYWKAKVVIELVMVLIMTNAMLLMWFVNSMSTEVCIVDPIVKFCRQYYDATTPRQADQHYASSHIQAAGKSKYNDSR
jgi:hypothetical protein